QKRVSIQGPRQADELALPGGQRYALVADAGIVSVRQLQDMRMGARRVRRGQYESGVGLLLHPADVLRDGAVEKRYVLRQIADIPADRQRVVLGERRAVEQDLAARERPHPDQTADERRLAGGARPDDAKAGARLKRERHA